MLPMRYLELLLRRERQAADSCLLSADSIPQSPAASLQSPAASYYLSGLLIDRRLDRFAREVGKYYTLDDHLPRYYREALVLYAHRTSHPAVVYHHAVTEEDWRNLQELKRQYPDPSERKVKVSEQFRDTYWYYFEYEP